MGFIRAGVSVKVEIFVGIQALHVSPINYFEFFEVLSVCRIHECYFL